LKYFEITQEKFRYFPDRGCVRTLCTLFGYSTASHWVLYVLSL